MYVVISLMSTMLPLLVVIILWRLLFSLLQSMQQKNRKLPEKTENKESTLPKKRDLAAEFERKLKEKRKPAAKEQIVIDSESKVYCEPLHIKPVSPVADKLPQTACGSRHQQPEQPAAVKVCFTHAALVNGFIMSEVLGKPRSLEPYKGDF